MNVLKPSEMVNLEEILKENSGKQISEFRNFKSFEIAYMRRARKLPLSAFNLVLRFQSENNLTKSQIIEYLSKKFKISEKDAENRIREVKKINNYIQERNNQKKLKQTI